MTKSIPLTQQMKERIETALLRHRFDAEVLAIEAARASLADLVYLDIYKAAQRAKMEDLPAGWLPEASGISVQFGEARDGYDHMDFSGKLYLRRPFLRQPSEDQKKQHRIACKHANGCAKIYGDTHKLTGIWRDLKAREAALNEQVREARAQIAGILRGVGSTKQLREAWPEAAPFLAGIAPPPSPKLPAPRLKDINAALNLPADEVAA